MAEVSFPAHDEKIIDEDEKITELPSAWGRPGRIRSQGPEITIEGVHYRTWCKHEQVQVIILSDDGGIGRTLPLEAEGDGYFSGLDKQGRAGDRYQYRFGERELWPDPASSYQPEGVHGPSMVIDSASYCWTDHD
jgi:maltooligosyltrehalose trehalohydrolase